MNVASDAPKRRGALPLQRMERQGERQSDGDEI